MSNNIKIVVKTLSVVGIILALVALGIYTRLYPTQQKMDQNTIKALRAWCPNDNLVFQLESATSTVGYFGCIKK